MRALQEVVRGVHLIDTYANTYIVTDHRLVVFDAGADRVPAKLLDALAALKVQPKDLTSIIVTHTHPDHVTGLAALHARYPARIAAHEIEAPYVARERTYPGPPRPSDHDAVPVDVRLQDGQSYEGFTVVHTPGHTLGSMSLYDPQRKLLVAGDAVRTEAGLAPMEDAYNVDPKQHRASIRRLAKLDVDTLVCGHGPPIVHGAGAQLKALASRLL